MVNVVGEEKFGSVMVLEPMIRTPELDITVWPSGSTVVTGPDGVSLEVVVPGKKVNVSPSVVSVVGEEKLGSVIVLDPMIRTPELEITVCPSGSTVVSGPDGTLRDVDEADDGEKVNVSPSVVKVVGAEKLGKLIVLEPITITPELETTVCPSGSVKVVASLFGVEVELELLVEEPMVAEELRVPVLVGPVKEGLEQFWVKHPPKFELDDELEGIL